MYIAINTGIAKTLISGFTSYDLSSEVFSTEFSTNPFYEQQIEKIQQVIKENVSEEIQAIGIAHTGDVDPEGKVIVSSSYTVDYVKRNITTDLQKYFPTTSMYIENDSVCATISEVYFGEAKEYTTVGLMYLSAGVGGAFLKKVNNVYSIFQAELGHQIIELNGKTCVCGQRGCLEAYVGGESVKRRFLMEQKEIIDERILKEITKSIAVGAANFYVMFYPEVLVLAGEMLEEVPYIKEHVINKIREEIFWEPDKNLPIILSKFGKKSPLYGALALTKIKEGGNSIQAIY